MENNKRENERISKNKERSGSKMADISVNEYVRTKLGIAKVEHYEDDIPHHTIWYTADRALDHVCFLIRDKDVIKHSFNLIDLIEVGDYVNGERVIQKDDDGIYIGLPEDYGWIGKNFIDTILTKENFKSMEYEVREDE